MTTPEVWIFESRPAPAVMPADREPDAGVDLGGTGRHEDHVVDAPVGRDRGEAALGERRAERHVEARRVEDLAQRLRADEIDARVDEDHVGARSVHELTRARRGSGARGGSAARARAGRARRRAELRTRSCAKASSSGAVGRRDAQCRASRRRLLATARACARCVGAHNGGVAVPELAPRRTFGGVIAVWVVAAVDRASSIGMLVAAGLRAPPGSRSGWAAA